MSWDPRTWFAPKVETEGPLAMAETYTLSDDRVLQAFYGALSVLSASGVRVTQESALHCMAVLACLIVRSETFSSLSVDLLRDEGEAGKVSDREHPAYRLLAVAPNPLMTAGEFWRWQRLATDIAGNSYAHIEWGRGLGRPTAIWPMTGAKPRLFTSSAGYFYDYQGDTHTPAGRYPVEDVLHWKGPVLQDPHEGTSLIDLASEAIGVAIGSEQFFARLLGNGTHFPGYLETDEALEDEDFDAIQSQLKKDSGLFGVGTLRIFDRGLKYRQNQMTLKDAQLVEQLRWQLQQICSVMRVPMAAVQDLTNGTYTNSEQQDLWLAKHTAAPICTDTERVIRHRLLAAWPRHEARWNLDALLRGDYKTRTEGDATLVRAGVLRRNEARGHYGLNPVDGLDVPLAELALGTVAPDGTISAPAKEGSASDSVALALAPVLADAAERIRRRARSDSERGRSRDETVAFALTRLAPVMQALATAGMPFDPVAFIEAAIAGDTSSTVGDA